MTPPTHCAVYLQGVTFTYEGAALPALRDVSLAVRRGEMVVIMGASRAGKSTLVKVLNRTIPSFEAGALTGEIWLLGRRCVQETVADFAGRVALVAQDFEAQLFSTSVDSEVAFALEQFGIAPEEMRRRVLAALKAVGLQGFEQRDPATLSGGEKQRLAIAAMLALEPELLLFDEPTTDLDPLGKQEVLAVLAGLRKEGRTLVVVEHETIAAEMADRVVFMAEGRVVGEMMAEDALRHPEWFRRCAVRPPDLPLLASLAGWNESPRSVEEAQAKVRAILEEKHWNSVPNEARQGETWNQQVLLAAENVSVHYEGGERAALENVSLEIRAGDFLALLGHNGSGKTTLAKCLNGLLRPTRGHVLWKGRPIASIPLAQRAAAVGYVFQNPDHQIFSDRVWDEVAFGPRNVGLPEPQVRERVQEALEAVGLLGREGDDPFWLTKGERQRLAVASLLALRPEVLILDEPTTGLDYHEQRQMMELVCKLHARGTTVIMITHTAWLVAEYAQRAVLLHQGQVLFDGGVFDLFAREDLLTTAKFRVPDVVRLGQRCGLRVRSVEELVALLKGEG